MSCMVVLGLHCVRRCGSRHCRPLHVVASVQGAGYRSDKASSSGNEKDRQLHDVTSRSRSVWSRSRSVVTTLCVMSLLS